MGEWGNSVELMEISDLKSEIERLTRKLDGALAALIALDSAIFNDPQVIDRAGEWRDLIAKELRTNEQQITESTDERIPRKSDR